MTLNPQIKTSIGMTLVEVIIYTALLSIIISSLVNYLFSVHFQNISTMNQIFNAYAN